MKLWRLLLIAGLLALVVWLGTEPACDIQKRACWEGVTGAAR